VAAGLSLALDDPPAVRIARAASFAALSLPIVLLALPGWLRSTRRVAGGVGLRWGVVAVLIGVQLPERLLRGALTDLLGMSLYASAVLLLTADRPRQASPVWRDLPLVLLLWLPLELRWVGGDGIMLRLFGLDLLLLLFVIERPIWEPGRIVPMRREEWAWGGVAYVAFLVVAIPIALVTGFAAPGLAERSAGEWLLSVAGTFWVIALPEEALFRGTIQQMLERAMRRKWAALAIASVIFGLAHLNNSNGEAPDWRYVLLATIAGVAYGIAYRRTGNLAAPTLTHCLVDVTWRGFFAGAA
jgi:membrane protease YdiL (CAAX protease family)